MFTKIEASCNDESKQQHVFRNSFKASEAIARKDIAKSTMSPFLFSYVDKYINSKFFLSKNLEIFCESESPNSQERLYDSNESVY